MDNGIYQVVFGAVKNGEGLIVVTDGWLHGGDQSYTYSGPYSADQGAVSADLKMVSYSKSGQSFFGDIAELELKLVGKFDGKAFKGFGEAVGLGYPPIKFTATKLRDI